VTDESDDIPEIVVDNVGQAFAHLWKWIRVKESEVERLAGESGQRQERTIGVVMQPGKGHVLRIHITCEPRQFAKSTTTGKWSKLLKSRSGDDTSSS
jgi:hypothetical protein